MATKSLTGSLPHALAITPTFRPWTHTSDDSYFYQLSLVVATATVSYNFESKMQSVALSRYEKMCVLHVRKKLSHPQLGSQSDKYG